MAKKITKKKTKAVATQYTEKADFGKICELPIVPPRELPPEVGPERASLIRNSEKKWANGTRLHYHFLTTPSRWAGSSV